MRMLSITELMRLSKRELGELEREMDAATEYPEGAVERSRALFNLQNIRFVMNRPQLRP